MNLKTGGIIFNLIGIIQQVRIKIGLCHNLLIQFSPKSHQWIVSCYTGVRNTNIWQQYRIGLPEITLGIIPGGGGTQRLPRLVGSGRAMQMILSGKLYSGKDAFVLGLIHSLAPPDRLYDEAVKILEPIFRNPQYALSLAKRAVRAAQGPALTEGYKVESKAFSQCFDQDYFVKLMIQQLKDGALKTTARLPEWIFQEGKKTV